MRVGDERIPCEILERDTGRVGQWMGLGHQRGDGNGALEDRHLQIVLVRQIHVLGDDLLEQHQDAQPAVLGHDVFQIFPEAGLQKFVVGPVQVGEAVFVIKETLEHKGGAGANDGEAVALGHGLRDLLDIIALGDDLLSVAHENQSLRRSGDAVGRPVKQGIADLLFHVLDDGAEMGLGDIAVSGGFVDGAALVRLQDIDEVFCVHVALSFSKRRRDLIPNSEGLTKSPIIRQPGEHVIIVTGKTKAPGQRGVQILSIIIAPIFKEYKIRTRRWNADQNEGKEERHGREEARKVR